MRDASAAVLLGMFLFAVCLTALSATTATLAAEVKGRQNPIPASEEAISRGGQVFGRFCRSCHGPEGKGDGGGAPEGATPANLVDETWDHGSTDTEIFKTIKEGVPPDFYMDAWEGRISEEDMWNVIHFIRDLAKRAKK